MLTKILTKLADNKRPDSMASHFRKRRFAMFKDLISTLPKPVAVLDVGGTTRFWRIMNYSYKVMRVSLYNILEMPDTPNIKFIKGDAQNMKNISNKEYDVVFSNSTIEHVGGFNRQSKVAKEIVRIGKNYFVQTPNKYFLLEPHFLFPFFQFLPLFIQVFILMNFTKKYTKRYSEIKDIKQAVATIKSIRLLSKNELQKLFPSGIILEEKFLVFTKSFIVHNFSTPD